MKPTSIALPIPLPITLSLGMLLTVVGCATSKTTDTARTAKEQLLVSNSIDRVLDKVDFTAFEGRAVFFDDQYLECVDKSYVVGSIRHRILRGGAQLVDKVEKAEVIVEARSGGVGTNNSELFVGTPELAVPGPFPLAIPEVKLLTRQMQTGTAKIGLVAYDAKTRTLLGEGGVTLAQSDDKNWYVFGVGPYQQGSIKSEVKLGVETEPIAEPLPSQVAFEPPSADIPGAPPTSPTSNGDVQWAGGEKKEETEEPDLLFPPSP